MGSRGRSIRLRIYLLVAIPLVTMAGLLAYVTVTTVNNAIDLDRAPNLINATSLPAARFGSYLQTERTAAVAYLFDPTPANLQTYGAATAVTDKGEPVFKAAMTSAGTISSQTPSEAKAISDMIGGLSQLPALRAGVKTQALTPLRALALYSQGLAANTKLFQAESSSQTDAYGATQGLGLVAVVQSREALSQEEALLSGMLAGNRMTPSDRAAFTQMAATRQADMQYADFLLTPANLAAYDAQLQGTAAQQQLTGIERAIGAGTPVSALPVTQAGWQALAGTLLQDNYNGGVAAAVSVLAGDHRISRSAWTRVAVTSGFGLIGLLLTILVTTLVGRGIIRRLRWLERSALTLAEDQLPDVIARLRRGEEVDVASEAPPLRIGRDEIGRVGQSFELVRQTAIRAAVDEAKLRRGLNDVFRSLARRSQSLLHRQLTLLDQMERRAADPAALDDLFRLDHLTTRMRRHAEGLVILAGAPPGRGWSSPVRMVDVMRGASAEVEDYARVTVATRSQAALSGSAVADVIHLLAELIENATTLSPPYTSVRVSGDTVASGFAIEVEDRGFGMSPSRIAELNERLASPPEFNPSDSEQLGLFVVSQLAKRHGVRVTLKASAYGGTAAIVLIPGHLVVAQDVFRAGLPGEHSAITAGLITASGHDGSAAELGGAGRPPVTGFPELRGFPGPIQVPGIRISGALRRAPGSDAEGADHGRQAATAFSPANGEAGTRAGTEPQTGSQTGADELPRRHDTAGAPNSAGPVPFAGVGPPSLGAAPPFDVFMPRRRAPDTAEPAIPAETSAPVAGFASAPVAGTAPYGSAGSAPYPDEPALFPGWTSLPSGRGSPGSPGTPPATPMTPVASGPPGRGSAPPWELSRQTEPLAVTPGGPDPDPAAGEPGSEGDVNGLPRRIRQASLAPQLRADPPRRRTTTASSGPSGGPTPAEIRQTMSALQRGWQEGRSGPPPGPSPSASASPEAGEGQDSTPDEKERGKSDGT